MRTWHQRGRPTTDETDAENGREFAEEREKRPEEAYDEAADGEDDRDGNEDANQQLPARPEPGSVTTIFRPRARRT